MKSGSADGQSGAVFVPPSPMALVPVSNGNSSSPEYKLKPLLNSKSGADYVGLLVPARSSGSYASPGQASMSQSGQASMQAGPASMSESIQASGAGLESLPDDTTLPPKSSQLRSTMPLERSQSSKLDNLNMCLMLVGCIMFLGAASLMGWHCKSRQESYRHRTIRTFSRPDPDEAPTEENSLCPQLTGPLTPHSPILSGYAPLDAPGFISTRMVTGSYSEDRSQVRRDWIP